jgi:hypothetical protein
VKAMFLTLPADGIMAGVVVRFCQDVSRTGRMGSMTDRREERDRARRERRKAAQRLREERKRRFEELTEAWRRNHPSQEEEKRPNRGRPA